MEKGQSKVRSFIEANVNTAIGFLVTLLISPIAYNTVGMKWNYNQLWQITAIFTIVSVIRGYIIRRFFNKKEESKEKTLLNKIKILENHNEILVASNRERGKILANLRTSLANKSTQIINLQDEYDFTIRVAREYISESQSKKYFTKIQELEKELDMCKHLHTAAISDLVEGADYFGADYSDKDKIDEPHFNMDRVSSGDSKTVFKNSDDCSGGPC